MCKLYRTILYYNKYNIAQQWEHLSTFTSMGTIVAHYTLRTVGQLALRNVLEESVVGREAVSDDEYSERGKGICVHMNVRVGTHEGLE